MKIIQHKISLHLRDSSPKGPFFNLSGSFHLKFLYSEYNSSEFLVVCSFILSFSFISLFYQMKGLGHLFHFLIYLPFFIYKKF